MAGRDWYGKKGDGKGGKDGGEHKPENMHERHSRERMETHGRHAKARDALNKQHEEELAMQAQRQNDEMAAAPAEGAGGGDAGAAAPAAAAAGPAAGAGAPAAAA